MDRPNGYFYSDSDDDRHSSSQSATSASEDAGESRLPSSLRKLLNPILPSAQKPSPMVFQSAGGPVTSAKACFEKEETLAGNDLTRLRPWKRLPPPRPLKAQPCMSLPPIYVSFPPPRVSNGTRESCSPSSPQFSPYYLPPPHSYRDRTGRVNDLQLASQCEDICKTHDSQFSSFTITPSSSLNPLPSSICKINDLQTNTKKKLNTLCNTVFHDTKNPRPEQHKISKKLQKANEKERNRCLTCGSAFSTFANLTRHEKKCPMANSQMI